MRNLGIKDFFLIWRKNNLNVDLGGGGKHIYIYVFDLLKGDYNSNIIIILMTLSNPI